MIIISLSDMEGFPRRRGYTRNVSENLDGGGLDPVWRRVLLDIVPILILEPDF